MGSVILVPVGAVQSTIPPFQKCGKGLGQEALDMAELLMETPSLSLYCVCPKVSEQQTPGSVLEGSHHSHAGLCRASAPGASSMGACLARSEDLLQPRDLV